MYTARKKSRSHKHNREIIQNDRFNIKTTKIFYVKKIYNNQQRYFIPRLLKCADRRSEKLQSQRQPYALDDCAIIMILLPSTAVRIEEKETRGGSETSRPEAMMFYTDFSAKRNNVRTRILFYFLLLFSSAETDIVAGLDDLFRLRYTAVNWAAFPFFTTSTRTYRNW